jgi:hypothetical protein
MDVVEVHSVRRYKSGYEVRDETRLTHWEDKPVGDSFRMKSAYTHDGHYIGSPIWGHRICTVRGILPELASPGDNVCSIGYCKRERKWYGWSHRAMYGFKPGSKVKKGHCGYQPSNKTEFKEDCLRFWSSDAYENITASFGSNEIEEYGPISPSNPPSAAEGLAAPTYREPTSVRTEHGVWVRWTYSNKIPNEDLRGKINGVFSGYPEKWGRGEWTARNNADAKQMAIDFAEGVG